MLFVFFILSILVFLNNNFPPVKFVTGAVQNIFVAPKTFLYGLKTTGGSDNSAIKKLTDENSALTKKLIDYDRTKRDNEALRSQFETSQTRNFKMMPTRILGFSGSFTLPGSFVIDKGSSNGVRQGMAVVVGNNLIGKIGRVSTSYSQVLLSINSNFRTLAKTSDKNTPGVARGNDDFILLDRVSVNDSITPKALLLTAGDIGESSFGIPPDLILGKIVSVNRSPSLPFQTAKVESQIRLDRLETVFIVLGF